MVEIQFSSPSKFAFVQRLLKASKAVNSSTDNDTELVCVVDDAVIGELLIRLNAGLPTILPVVSDKYDEWVVIATSQIDLDQTLQQMNRFLLPTFGIYPQNNNFPRLETFDNPSPDLFDKYYSWYTPHNLRRQIMTSIALWLNVMKQAPRLDQLLPPTFKDLYRQFRLAITSYNWVKAEQIIDQLHHNSLTPSHNIAFLKIELFAQQEDYERIWKDEDLKKWVFHSVPIPRRVQVALLKAFHHQLLLHDEQSQRYDAVIATFRKEQASLGKLLISRQDIIDDVVVRVFGYLAVIDETIESLATLTEIKTLNAETVALLSELQKFIKPTIPKAPLERYQDLLNDGKYETAYEVANSIENKIEKFSALIISAAFLEQEVNAREVLQSYENLDLSDQQVIVRAPYTKLALKQLRQLVPNVPDTYTDWLMWFDAMFQGVDSETLNRSLDSLEQNSDKEYWTLNRAEKLWGFLGVMSFDPKSAPLEDQKMMHQSFFVRAMDWLINQFVVEDHEFPREQSIFGDLYSSFFEYMLYAMSPREENADKVFRLADDYIVRNPGKNLTITKSLFRWLSSPRSEIGALALETFELSIQHGVGKEYLYDIYREWVEKLIDSPVHYDLSTLEVWNSLGQWFGENAGYLINKIQDRIDLTKLKITDPITLLPAGYHIVIYTLDETSAKRVENLLLERHPSLKIDLYTEKSVTDRMKLLTQNADMHVIVWRCMKHNVYYKIKSYVNDPVLPISRGSSSILGAIEDKAQMICEVN